MWEALHDNSIHWEHLVPFVTLEELINYSWMYSYLLFFCIWFYSSTWQWKNQNGKNIYPYLFCTTRNLAVQYNCTNDKHTLASCRKYSWLVLWLNFTIDAVVETCMKWILEMFRIMFRIIQSLVLHNVTHRTIYCSIKEVQHFWCPNMLRWKKCCH